MNKSLLLTALMTCQAISARQALQNPQRFSLEKPTSSSVKEFLAFSLPAAAVWSYLNTIDPYYITRYYRYHLEHNLFPNIGDKIVYSGLTGLITWLIYVINSNDAQLQSAKDEIRKVNQNLLAAIDASQESAQLIPYIEQVFSLSSFPLASAFQQLHETYVELVKAQERLKEVQKNNSYAQEAAFHLATIESYITIIAKGKQLIKSAPDFGTQLQAKQAQDSIAAQEKIAHEIRLNTISHY